MQCSLKLAIVFLFLTIDMLVLIPTMAHAQLMAGAAKVDITDREAGPVNDTLYVKALVLKERYDTLCYRHRRCCCHRRNRSDRERLFAGGS